MRKYWVYLIFYSIGGYILERIINLIFLQAWVDNRVLIGLWQPMYGLGVVLTIIVYAFLIKKYIKNTYVSVSLLILTAIAMTGLSEFSSGTLYEALTGIVLWDYSDTFSCTGPYVCTLPTSLFGVLSGLVVYKLHPVIKTYIERIPKSIQYLVIGLFIIDIIVTLFLIIN